MRDSAVMRMVHDVLRLAEEALEDRVQADLPAEKMDAHSEGEIEACCALLAQWVDLIDPEQLPDMHERVNNIEKSLMQAGADSLVGDVLKCRVTLRNAYVRYMDPNRR